tara:strand:+ start:8680 stop:8997 length:318 start_codon:yes stop_codon:yes gene_type:complete
MKQYDYIIASIIRNVDPRIEVIMLNPGETPTLQSKNLSEHVLDISLKDCCTELETKFKALLQALDSICEYPNIQVTTRTAELDNNNTHIKIACSLAGYYQDEGRS